jgi:polyhydroxyalkanoate synthesis regulator phasin
MITISSKIKDYLFKGALVLACSAAIWQNIQVLIAKEQRIVTQEAVIAQLTQVNEDLRKDIVNKAKSEIVTEQSKEILSQVVDRHERAKTQANLYVEKKLIAIESKYALMEKNAINAERKRVEISLERAKGLWLTYCLQEPLDVACK